MTRKLEELLGLPRLDEAIKELEAEQAEVEMIDADYEEDAPVVQAVAPMSAAPMPPAPMQDSTSLEISITARDLAEHEQQMDELSHKAISTFDEMKDLGFSVEPKDAGTIFEPMVQMLKLAMDSKASKIDRKMKLMRLKLDMERLEHQKAMKPTEGFVEGDATPGVLLDRNDLLAHLSGPKGEQ